MQGLIKLRRRDLAFLAVGALIISVIWGITTLVKHSQLPIKPQTDSITTAWIPATVRRWEKPIIQMADRYQLDPNLIAIIMTLESGGNPKALSEADAKGLMQITGPTEKDIAAKFLNQPIKNVNIYDPTTNIEFGTAYLAYLRDTFGEWNHSPTWDSTVELVAAGYNGGPGAANSLYTGKGLRDTQTVVYSRDAFNMWRERFSANSPTYERWLERGGQRLIEAAKNEK